MSAAPYRADQRDRQELLAGLEDAARRVAFHGPQTWHDVLFTPGFDEREPSRALLVAVAGALAGAVGHLDVLPAAARAAFLEDRLGIERLPIVPDTVVGIVDGDAKRLPVTLPKGSRLRAGKTEYGERLYETTENLVVLGVPLVGAHAYRVFADHDSVVRHVGPLPGKATGTLAGEGEVDATHELIVASDLLRLESGAATIFVEFHGVTFGGAAPGTRAAMLAFFAALTWEMASDTEEGFVPLGVDKTNSSTPLADSVRLCLTASGPNAARELDGQSRYHLRARFPGTAGEGFARSLAFGLAFRDVSLQVRAADVAPQAGFADAGLLDLTKEFAPFGPAPRRGSAFYLRSDEAFAKPLAHLTVKLDLREEVVRERAHHGHSHGRPTREIAWQQYVAGDWATLGTNNDLDWLDVNIAASGAPLSDPVPLGGDVGRAIRAVLAYGDFGWQSYLDTLAANARYAAAGQPANVVVAKQPEPPVVERVRIDYTTAEVTSSATGTLVSVYSRNALSAPVEMTGQTTIEPFTADPPGTATLYVGLDRAVPLGETVSLYLEVDAATSCDAAEASATVAFEYDSGSGWKQLETADGTEALRQSGIVRFVAPLDWTDGSAAAAEPNGRWLRARLTATSLPARVRRIQTDAVYARYLPAPGHESDDDTPATPLPALAVKGLVTAVPGIKKLTNPRPSWGGRGPERDTAYAARANGVVRHRNRAITAWDVEELVRSTFPEVALVRCLPHHSQDSECAPGWLSVVVVPHSDDRAPIPSVQLATSVEDMLVARGPSGLSVAVLCPLYAEVTVQATVKLVQGASGRDSHVAIESALNDFLHPLRTTRRAAGFGRSLFRSEVARLLESHPLVDYIEASPQLSFGAPYSQLDRIDVDACRGLIASAADQQLVVETTL